jgi:hypothetical protein
MDTNEVGWSYQKKKRNKKGEGENVADLAHQNQFQALAKDFTLWQEDFLQFAGRIRAPSRRNYSPTTWICKMDLLPKRSSHCIWAYCPHKSSFM